MPSYDDVVRSLEADGFHPKAFSVKLGSTAQKTCDHCGGPVPPEALGFEDVKTVGSMDMTIQLWVCLDRVACRARSTAREEKKAADTEAAHAAVAAAVILPDEETFPENHD